MTACLLTHFFKCMITQCQLLPGILTELQGQEDCKTPLREAAWTSKHYGIQNKYQKYLDPKGEPSGSISFYVFVQKLYTFFFSPVTNPLIFKGRILPLVGRSIKEENVHGKCLPSSENLSTTSTLHIQSQICCRFFCCYNQQNLASL